MASKKSWKDFCNKQDPFHEACASGRIDCVMELWDGPGALWLQDKRGFYRGINAISTDEKARPGWTPLFYAATSGSAEVLRFLIQEGADCNHRDRYNETAVAYAKGNHIRQIIKNEHLKSEFRLKVQSFHNDAHADISEVQAKFKALCDRDIRNHPSQHSDVDDAYFQSKQRFLDSIKSISSFIISTSSGAYQSIREAREALDRLNALKKIFFGRLILSDSEVTDVTKLFCDVSGDPNELMTPDGMADIAKKQFHNKKIDFDFVASLIFSYDASFGKGSLTLSEFIRSFEEFKWSMNLFFQKECIDDVMDGLHRFEVHLAERLLLMQNFAHARGCLERAQQCIDLMTANSLKGAEEYETWTDLMHRLEAEERKANQRNLFVESMASVEHHLERSRELYSSCFTRSEAVAMLSEAQKSLLNAKESFKSCNCPPIMDPDSLQYLFQSQIEDPTNSNQVKDMLSGFGIIKEDDGWHETDANGTIGFDSFLNLYIDQKNSSWRLQAATALKDVQDRISQHDSIMQNSIQGELSFGSAEEAFQDGNYTKSGKLVVDANVAFALCPRNDFKLLCSELYLRAADANNSKHKQSAYNFAQEAQSFLSEGDFDAAAVAVRNARSEYLEIGLDIEASGLDGLCLRIAQAEAASIAETFRPTFERLLRQADSMALAHDHEHAHEAYDDCLHKCQTLLQRCPGSPDLKRMASALRARKSLALSAMAARAGLQGGPPLSQLAAAEAQACVELAPEWPPAYGLLGVSKIAAGAEAEAAGDLRRGAGLARPGGPSHRMLLVLERFLAAAQR